MIIRVFRPTIHPGKEAEFESFLRETAIPLGIAAVRGDRAACGQAA
jgi:hypothetical protein